MLYVLPIVSHIVVATLICGCFTPGHADELSTLISTVTQKAQQDGKKMTLPINKKSNDGLQAAKETAQIFSSKEFQQTVQTEEKRLRKNIFVKRIAPWKKQIQTATPKNKGRIYLFLSSSIPDETMQTYISIIAHAGVSKITPIMRGFIQPTTSLEATTDYFSRILKKNPQCQEETNNSCEFYPVAISLKPSLFAQYDVSRVPALLFKTDQKSYLIRGDASLDYLLEAINRQEKSVMLTRLIKKIRGRF